MIIMSSLQQTKCIYETAATANEMRIYDFVRFMFIEWSVLEQNLNLPWLLTPIQELKVSTELLTGILINSIRTTLNFSNKNNLHQARHVESLFVLLYPLDFCCHTSIDDSDIFLHSKDTQWHI